MHSAQARAAIGSLRRNDSVSGVFLALLFLAAVLVVHPVAAAPDATSWRFDVYLDNSRIGFHEFRLRETAEGTRRLEAEARFDVKFFFVNAFRYRHEIEETWSGNCLTALDARTNSNGKRTEVAGSIRETGFRLEVGDDAKVLDDCVMTFAYWNPAFLKQDRLLNPQTGEFLSVDVKELEASSLELSSGAVDAKGYLVQAPGLEVRVWYGPNDQWLALESSTKGGRIIRYELQT